MPNILPFAALRYDERQIGCLSDVIAPPYDVIDPKLQDQLYDRHAANAVRIVLNRRELGDQPDQHYQRAAAWFSQWMADGVLRQDSEPAFYVYNQQFEYAKQKFCRRGFIGTVRLERFGTGNVFPHEETHSVAKADRLKLIKACGINCSQVFGLYPDADNDAQFMLEAVTGDQAPIAATDHLGVEHKMWVVRDKDAIDQVASVLADKPLFIADGHHRYETACDYRDYLSQQNGPLPKNHPANFVMTNMVSMSDPGLIILPTHRLFEGTPILTGNELADRLGDHFRCEKIGTDAGAAIACWDLMELADRQNLMAVFAAGDGQWLLCEATAKAADAMRMIAPQLSEDWRSLGVSMLHKLVMETILQATPHPEPTYVHTVTELRDRLASPAREMSAEPAYTMAALVMPARISDVEAISLNQERMPAKSTYFYPKLASGLTFNRLYKCESTAAK